MEIYERVPPQALDIEASVLGMMLLDPDAVAVGVEMLEPDVFYRRQHREVFEAIAELSRQGENVDSLTVGNRLRATKKLEAAGGVTEINRLTGRVASGANIGRHCAILNEKAILRKLVHIGAGIVDSAFGDESAERQCDAAIEKIIGVVGSSYSSGLESVADFIPGIADLVDKFQRGEVKSRRVWSGLKPLDTVTGGFVPGEVSIIAAKPGDGKSALATQIALDAASRGERVAIFSVEMPKAVLRRRLIAQYAQVDCSSMEKAAPVGDEPWKIPESGMDRIRVAEDYIRGLHIAVNDHSGLSVDDIRTRLRAYYGREKPDLVIVDYLQLLKPERDTGSRNLDVAAQSWGLKQIAKSLDCVVLALSQFNRASEGRADKKPVLADLRDSGAIEQDAALVIAIHRPTLKTAELKILKNRHGQKGDCVVEWNGPTLTFSAGGIHAGV